MRLFIRPFEIEFEFVFAFGFWGKSCGLFLVDCEKSLPMGTYEEMGTRERERGRDQIRCSG